MAEAVLRAAGDRHPQRGHRPEGPRTGPLAGTVVRGDEHRGLVQAARASEARLHRERRIAEDDGLQGPGTRAHHQAPLVAMPDDPGIRP